MFSISNVGLGTTLGVEITAERSSTPDAAMTPAVISAVAPGDTFSQVVVEVAFPTEPLRNLGAAHLALRGTLGDRVPFLVRL